MTAGPEWFLLAFLAFWLLTCAFMSVVGGWYQLARSFRSRKRIEGERFGFCAGAMGWGQVPVSYGRSLFVVVGAEAFSLSVMFPLRPMHPPLVIPWSAVERCENVRHWLTHRVAVHVAGHTLRVLVGGAAGQRILAHWVALAGSKLR